MSAKVLLGRAVFYLFIYSLVIFWASITCFKLFLELVCHPVSFFKSPKKRPTPPQCLLDESLGKHEYVRANGIKFHYVTSGDKSNPLMLLIHGFPEMWYSWRHQLREFSSDYHVVAVDLRGYGDTERPPRKQDYQISHLRQDIVELIPALGHSSAILVAHDWGGAIAWAVAQKNPELLEKLIIMNSPHHKAMNKAPAKQLLKSWYMFMFQVPWLPEFVATRNDFGVLENFLRGNQGGVINKDAITAEDIEAYKYTFSQPGGLTSPINYYRAIFSGPPARTGKGKKIEVPTLILWGDEDHFLDRTLADLSGQVVKDATVKHIPNCSHWTQQDQPKLVNQYMREFL